MTNAMIKKAENAIEEAKERCSFAYEAGFKHYGQNYRMRKDTETGTWKVFRCSETDIHDSLVGEIREEKDIPVDPWGVLELFDNLMTEADEIVKKYKKEG